MLTNRADEDHKNYFEEYGMNKYVCTTCHVGYGPIILCRGCDSRVCEACEVWSIGKMRLLNLNRNKRTKKKQRYVLEYIKCATGNCNRCDRVIRYRL